MHLYLKQITSDAPVFRILGHFALERFPRYRSDIQRVLVEQQFEIKDLVWISRSIAGSIRCTIQAEAYRKIDGQQILQDALYGEGPVIAHLYFQWQTALDDSARTFGHFDLLVARQQTLFSLLLPRDVTRQEIYVYTCFLFSFVLTRNMYIYI